MSSHGDAANPVLVVGSVALDTVETPFGRVENELGGAATYSAVAASFFAPVRMVAVVGEDFPAEHLGALAARGVDLRGVERAEGLTFRWAGRYEGDMSQAHTLATHLNVFERFQPVLPEAYRATPYLFLANIDPGLQLNVLDQITEPRLVQCDTMNYWITGRQERLLDVLRRCDVILMNDAEVCLLCEADSTIAAMRRLRDLLSATDAPRAIIVKKGEHGALLLGRDGWFAAPSYPVSEVRDPTGAGDVFAGALIGALARAGKHPDEGQLRRAIILGTVLASFVVEDFGLRRLLRLRPEEIQARYRELARMTEFPVE